jgi:hypothetical protein
MARLKLIMVFSEVHIGIILAEAQACVFIDSPPPRYLAPGILCSLLLIYYFFSVKQADGKMGWRGGDKPKDVVKSKRVAVGFFQVRKISEHEK